MPKPSKRLKKPCTADLSEVIISRDGDYADIAYRDPTVGGVNLKIGSDISLMSDKEILDRHNQVLLAREQAIADYVHEAVEIPRGKPQVEYSERCDQWVPRGDVLRCVIHDRDGRRAVIEIDGKEFTLEEFGTMLTTFSGWGMRIVFVPEGELEKQPDIVIREPEDQSY
jgi:hypothetical protein